MTRLAVIIAALTLALGLSLSGEHGVEAPTEPEVPALIQVAERGDLGTLEALLARDQMPDVRDSCDWTPLMKAAQNGHLEAVERLVNAGASLDAEDKGGYTAVMLAAGNGHAAVVRRLLAAGAMADHQERTQGWTALIWAVKEGRGETVAALLQGGADPSLRDYSGRTATDWARELGRPAMLATPASARTD
jgi:ankyrin repeat protein